MDSPDQPKGVIDFKKARNQLNAARKAKGPQNKGGSGGLQKSKFMLYLQYIVLLLVVSYLMQLCRS